MSLVYFWLVFVLVVLGDQLFKFLVRSNGWFWTLNEGVAFSIGQDWWWMEWVVWGTVAALLLLYIKYQILNIKNTYKN